MRRYLSRTQRAILYRAIVDEQDGKGGVRGRRRLEQAGEQEAGAVSNPAMKSSPSIRSIVLLSPWNTRTLSVAWLNSRALYSSTGRCHSRYVAFWSGGSSLEGLLAFRDPVR